MTVTFARHVSFYRAAGSLGVKEMLHYRGAYFLGMLGFLGEPVVYLVVWSAVAEAQGGSVGGLTVSEVVAYYIVWTLVRNLTSFVGPETWSRRIINGTLADLLLRPIHPLHQDFAASLGGKVVIVPLWLPVGIALTLTFKPALDPSVAEVAAFLLAVILAWLVRGMMFSVLGMTGFRTAQVSALTQVYMAFELLLSGRLVPLSFFPSWLANSAEWLPFYRSFGFPIDVVTRSMTGGEIVLGLVVSLIWFAVLLAIFGVAWRRGVRHFSAVGG